MLSKPIAAAIAALLTFTVAPAFAQNTSSGQDQSSSSSQGTSHQVTAQTFNGTSIRKMLQQHLSDQGFTDVQVEPSSFLVRAKNKQGEPVVMVIGPDSFTEVTELPSKNGSGSANGSSQGGMGNSSSSSQK